MTDHNMKKTFMAPRGAIYAIQFDSGLVKVGKSLTPEARIESHARSGAMHGRKIVNSWFSDLHNEYGFNEKMLIEFCSQIWGRASYGMEWFQDADWKGIVEFAKGLSFDGEEREQEVGPFSLGLADTIARGLTRANDEGVDELDHLVQAISTLFGISKRDARRLYSKPGGPTLFWKYVELWNSYEDHEKMKKEWFDIFYIAVEHELGVKGLKEVLLEKPHLRAKIREIYGFDSKPIQLTSMGYPGRDVRP